MADITAGYEEFCLYLEKHSGICLGANKQYLVSSRLRRLMADNDLKTLNELLSKINLNTHRNLKTQVIDAMTTNETLWFRDSHPFRILEEKLLPEFYAARNMRPLRIWSAACSTGQEPYSMSMIIQDYKARKGVAGMGEKIVATDISPSALEQAKAGEYPSLAIGRGLDTSRLKKHFKETTAGRFKIDPKIASCVEFRQMNLQDSYSLLGKFDIIFCRNVLIYFTGEFKQDILKRMHASLNPGGYLMVGASEAINGLNEYYEMVHCRPGIIYRKK
ncbi:CheR family methyltransferase [Reinekea marinisedimentorum]|uniref:protein-glutamate O-methyltransferase n=1 Tax=Reinekea marinisedimentorum TaxID=230495 RepID=A0A4R3I2X5_9GAMM|nr:protein-glutamate O-methyltransferase CheR [Reinekea marinisedimentorum]TCS39922.1 chemotaxis protein methyltransferase CheR [Reinekea marinisedimentorum]